MNAGMVCEWWLGERSAWFSYSLTRGKMFDEKGPHGCFWSMVSFKFKPDFVII